MPPNKRKSTITLVLHNQGTYLTGGDIVDGHIEIDVKDKDFVLQKLDLRRRCNIYRKVWSSTPEGNSLSPNDIRGKSICFYKDEIVLISSPIKLADGVHRYPFMASLPMECPPTVSYSRDRVYHRILGYAQFTCDGLFDEEFWDGKFYDYYPVHYISDFNDKTPLSSSIELQTYFYREINEKMQKFIPWKKRMNEADDPKSKVDVTFTYPKNGIRQDMANNFGLSVRNVDSNSPEFQISDLTISIICTACEKFANVRYSNIVAKHELVNKTLYAPAKEVDITDIIVNAEKSQVYTPSFISPHLSFRNDLQLTITLAREVNGKSEVARIEEKIFYTVLSPEVRQDPKDPKGRESQDQPPQPVSERPISSSITASMPTNDENEQDDIHHAPDLQEIPEQGLPVQDLLVQDLPGQYPPEQTLSHSDYLPSYCEINDDV